MSLNHDEKIKEIEKLQMLIREISNTRIAALDEDDTESASKFRVRENQLIKQVDDLTARLMLEWTADARNTQIRISSCEIEAMQELKGMRDRKEFAQTMVQTLGLLDDVINLATKFIV